MYYVVLYDGKGGKSGGYDCVNPIDGSRRLPIQGNAFIFASTACFKWEPDCLPFRQWFLEVDNA